MKKIVCFLLSVSIMLSLSVFSFAGTQIIPFDESDPAYGCDLSSSGGIVPYALVPSTGQISILTGRSGTNGVLGTWSNLASEDDLFIGSGAILSYVGSSNSSYQNAFFVRRDDALPTGSPNYWWNFIGKITDANGYVLKSSDFSFFGIQMVSSSGSFSTNQGAITANADTVYSFDDGYLQIAVSHNQWNLSNYRSCLYAGVSNSSVVSPLSFEVEKFEIYSGESSTTEYPFTFGAGAHTVTPSGPKDPNDASQYGDAEDQVEWYNDAYGAAVNPDLGDKMSATTDMLLQEQEIEEQMIDGINQYAPAVDPANLSMPTQIVNGLSFIGNTFMSSYNALGDIGFVISFSMMLGVVLVLIGRGEGALARGIASSARERSRTEYASDRDMKKGG